MPDALWDADHPYYCEEGNYYKTGCHEVYDSWAEFFDAEGDDDPDMNLVFRWDWQDGHLSLFFVGQRKALLRSVGVAVRNEDEPAVREWLTERAKTIAAIWAPIEVREGGEPS